LYKFSNRFFNYYGDSNLLSIYGKVLESSKYSKIIARILKGVSRMNYKFLPRLSQSLSFVKQEKRRKPSS